MNDRARQRTIEQAEADAQAMVGELERLVEALRAARAEAGIATLGAPIEAIASAEPAEPVPCSRTGRARRTTFAAALGRATAVPAGSSAAARPRRTLTSALGLAAVAVVGMVGAAVVTVARDTPTAGGGASGMTPLPYAQTAARAAASAHGAAPLPLDSAAPVAHAADAPPSSPAAADERRRHQRWDHSAPDYPATTAGQELLARALEQAEEAEARELQALAQSTDSPTPAVPRLPPYDGRHRRR